MSLHRLPEAVSRWTTSIALAAAPDRLFFDLREHRTRPIHPKSQETRSTEQVFDVAIRRRERYGTEPTAEQRCLDADEASEQDVRPVCERINEPRLWDHVKLSVFSPSFPFFLLN